ncbi:hypothetical protein D3C86_1183300 [compost metagenome]
MVTPSFKMTFDLISLLVSKRLIFLSVKTTFPPTSTISNSTSSVQEAKVRNKDNMEICFIYFFIFSILIIRIYPRKL